MKKECNVPHRFTCFHCIEGSTNPDICTSCGAVIGEFDFEAAVFMPPQIGRYRVSFNCVRRDNLLAALDVAREEYLQRFEIIEDGEGVAIVSLDIAYSRLIKELSFVMGIAEQELSNAIFFQVLKE